MEIESLKWRMPHGHAGLVGWAFTDGNGWIVPSTAGEWIVADGDSGDIPPIGLPDSGGFQVTGYNLGAFPHTIFITFHLNPNMPAHVSSQLIAAGRLHSGGSLRNAGPPVGRR